MIFMLTPEELRNLPDELVALYVKLETEALKEMSHALKRRLQGKEPLDAVINDQNAELRRLVLANRKRVKKTLKKTIKKAIALNMQNDAKLTKSPLLKATTAINSGLAHNLIRAGEQRILTELLQLDRSLPAYCEGTVRRLLFEVGARGTLKAINADMTYEEAIADGIKKLAKRGIVLKKKNGVQESIDVVVRRNVLTGISNVASEMSMQNAMELGFQYVEVSAHAGARNTGFGYLNHESWQGKVYHVSDPAEALKLAKLARPIGY